MSALQGSMGCCRDGNMREPVSQYMTAVGCPTPQGDAGAWPAFRGRAYRRRGPSRTNEGHLSLVR